MERASGLAGCDPPRSSGACPYSRFGSRITRYVLAAALTSRMWGLPHKVCFPLSLSPAVDGASASFEVRIARRRTALTSFPRRVHPTRKTPRSGLLPWRRPWIERFQKIDHLELAKHCAQPKCAAAAVAVTASEQRPYGQHEPRPGSGAALALFTDAAEQCRPGVEQSGGDTAPLTTRFELSQSLDLRLRRPLQLLVDDQLGPRCIDPRVSELSSALWYRVRHD